MNSILSNASVGYDFETKEVVFEIHAHIRVPSDTAAKYKTPGLILVSEKDIIEMWEHVLTDGAHDIDSDIFDDEELEEILLSEAAKAFGNIWSELTVDLMELTEEDDEEEDTECDCFPCQLRQLVEEGGLSSLLSPWASAKD